MTTTTRSRARRAQITGDVGDHSGYVETGAERVAVLETILAENDRTADANRAALRRRRGRDGQPDVLARRGQDDAAAAHPRRSATRLRLGVLEGDIATSLDADRARRARRAGRRS